MAKAKRRVGFGAVMGSRAPSESSMSSRALDPFILWNNGTDSTARALCRGRQAAGNEIRPDRAVFLIEWSLIQPT